MLNKVKELATSASLKTKMAVAGSAVALSAAMPMVAFAEGETTTGVTEAVNAVTAVSSLFTNYPMNVFLGCGIALAAFRVFRGAKGASGGSR